MTYETFHLIRKERRELLDKLIMSAFGLETIKKSILFDHVIFIILYTIANFG